MSDEGAISVGPKARIPNVPRVARRAALAALLLVAAGACGGSEPRADAAGGEGEGGAAERANVDVVLAGVRSDSGVITSVLCRKGEQFPNSCALRATAPAKAGAVVLQFTDVPAGRYAFAAFHDENRDGVIGMSPAGLPLEGLGFSNDAIGRSGPPPFDASAFDVSKGTKVAVRLRYW